jgi:hypothetical protein
VATANQRLQQQANEMAELVAQLQAANDARRATQHGPALVGKSQAFGDH